VAAIEVPKPASDAGPMLDAAALGQIVSADERYLETRPGQHMTLVFAPDAAPTAGAQESDTYLIAWQGWYNEWLRGAWLANPTRTEPFVPGDAAMMTALRRWINRKPSFEREFYASAIPVR
jgi:hypothetical protein